MNSELLILLTAVFAVVLGALVFLLTQRRWKDLASRRTAGENVGADITAAHYTRMVSVGIAGVGLLTIAIELARG